MVRPMKTICSKLAASAAFRLLKLAYPELMNGVEILVCFRGYAENVGDGRKCRFCFLLTRKDQCEDTQALLELRPAP
ncbi:MAG: hypothetical protein CGU28_12100 [Candidatus Dactylopiibacterium carminicum]|uniref:Uncharacterized protein n=1 Tax=Candidatus Dactylopiibacterium carminicum TaxID=857335 RepID=A0A272EPU0_9RHOO|nr:hypothetical protein BGI27_13400 [Candidatus Dactylopiibacterium carminicum]PAS92133.1 MAG: hypothetical protein CGU29_12770 [Candidatus Dactylopiibacterium carminicum]PAS95560.1 MAG: hypothetical protein CGU28_12100 [Candidatus Dactylopiibacterium carminicum]PAS97549.1 MAG: hypothetical protein BSR46_13420 [Candidatus Dactylopiibacterium carminicum]